MTWDEFVAVVPDSPDVIELDFFVYHVSGPALTYDYYTRDRGEYYNLGIIIDREGEHHRFFHCYPTSAGEVGHSPQDAPRHKSEKLIRRLFAVQLMEHAL